MEKKKINVKKIIRITILLIILITIPTTIMCRSSCMYSEKGHYRRIQKRIEERFITTGLYEEYELYPLYDEEDKLRYFVVEFSPTDYRVISINKYDFGCLGASMYSLFETNPWQRYVLDNGEKIYEKDKDGNDIFYNQSPYKVAGIKDEKRYLINVKQDSNPFYVPAVKRGDKYLNLISMKEEEIILESKEEVNESWDIYFFIKPRFDL